MDTIFIRDLRIDTVIGIYDWERAIRQTISLDLEMGTDIARAAASDHIDDTLNYKAVAKRVIAFVEESRFQLVETLAERVAQLILDEFGVPWVRLVLNKGGALRGAAGVGIVIERGREG
ncbi:MAG TPA: dihydroneopterin aldolase [Gammaproteobacteria bacterium]|nr:dihydroneopterin aldolase [Gammaproteobacteria bacterium]